MNRAAAASGLRWAGRRLTRALRQEDGVTAIEFAIMLPVMLLLFFGAFELGRFVWLQVKVDRVAVSLGDLVSREASVSTSVLNSVFVAAEEITSPFPTGNLSQVIITSISPDGAGTPKINWQRSGGGGLGEASRVAPCSGGKITLPAGLILSPSDVLIVTEAFYSYSPAIATGIVPTNIVYRNSFFRPRIASLATITDSPAICDDD